MTELGEMADLDAMSYARSLLLECILVANPYCCPQSNIMFFAPMPEIRGYIFLPHSTFHKKVFHELNKENNEMLNSATARMASIVIPQAIQEGSQYAKKACNQVKNATQATVQNATNMAQAVQNHLPSDCKHLPARVDTFAASN